MEKYTIKEVPDIRVRYVLRNGEQGKIVFDDITDYKVCTDCGTITIHFMCANDDFFTEFKKVILENRIYGCILDALNARRSVITGEDEEYNELKNLRCKAPSLSYYLSREGEPADFILRFPIYQGEMNDLWMNLVG